MAKWTVNLLTQMPDLLFQFLHLFQRFLIAYTDSGNLFYKNLTRNIKELNLYCAADLRDSEACLLDSSASFTALEMSCFITGISYLNKC